MDRRRPARMLSRRQLFATGGGLLVPAALLAWWRPWKADSPSPSDTSRATATPAPPTATLAPERIALPTAQVTSPAATPATPIPATPTGQRATGTILYLGTLGGQAGIIAASADGGERRLIAPGEYRGVAWAPGGYRFAAVGPLRGGFTDQVAIFYVDGRPLARYAFEGKVGDQLFWSPNEDVLACIVTPYRSGPGQPGPSEIWQIAMHGEARRVTLPTADPAYPFAWTPAGLLSVVSHGQSQQRTVWTASADGTHAVREVEGRINPLALALDGETLYAIRWSADPPHAALVAIALRTDTPRTIGDDARLSEFAFGASATPDTYFLGSVTFAPDRTHLAAVVTNSRTAGMPPQAERALVFVRIDGVLTGSLRFPPGAWPGPFAWSPDGTMLACGSSGGAERTLTVTDSRGTRLVEAPFSPSIVYGDMALGWSPDGRWLAYAHLNGITVVSPHGLPAYELAPVGGAIAWQPRAPR
jgi:hypothetical protein